MQKKKIFSVIMALTLCVSCLPLSLMEVKAAELPTLSENEMAPMENSLEVEETYERDWRGLHIIAPSRDALKSDGASGGYILNSDGDYSISGTWDAIGLTSPSEPSDSHDETYVAVLTVAAGVSANITFSNVTIDASGKNYASAFRIANDSVGDVHLILDGTNILKGGLNCPAIQKKDSDPEVLDVDGNKRIGTLTIEGEGSLEAVGGKWAAGIGGGAWQSTSHITINGGKITATAGSSGAGIGGGSSTNMGTNRLKTGHGTYITINNGEVTATGGDAHSGAGIGGGGGGYLTGGHGSHIEINGGIVTANGGYRGGAGIGGSDCSVPSDGGEQSVKITGGIVTATGGSAGGAGIGSGYTYYDETGVPNPDFKVEITGGTVIATGGASGGAGIGGGKGFQAQNITIDGDAFVYAKVGANANGSADAIGTGNKAVASTPLLNKGVIIQNTEGQVYGEVTLKQNVTVPTGTTVTVPEGQKLLLLEGVTLTNEGTIDGSGTLGGAGSFVKAGSGIYNLKVPRSISAPVVSSVTSDSVTLKKVSAPYGGGTVYYTMSETTTAPTAESSWSTDRNFINLDPGEKLYFFVRVTAGDAYAKAVSTGTEVYTAPLAPIAGEGYAIDYAAETITVTDGYEVSSKSDFGSDFISSGSITGIIPDNGSEALTLYVRKKANDDIPASGSAVLTVSARPAAPVIEATATIDKITISPEEGVEYCINNQAYGNTIFSGLNANTEYTISARKKAVANTSFASKAFSKTVKTKSSGVVTVPRLNAVTYQKDTTLADIVLGSGWAWSDDSITPTVAVNSYAAVYTPTDADSTDYSGESGYAIQNGVVTITRDITLHVKPVKVTLPVAETNLLYTGQLQHGITVPEDALYTVTGDATGINAGNYAVTVSLKDKSNFVWDLAAATSADQTIKWEIKAVEQPKQPSKAEQFVTVLYQKALERKPSDSELKELADPLTQQTITAAVAVARVLSKEEFTARSISNEQYVDLLYNMLLERGADMDGRKYWVDVLESGADRNTVLRGFTLSGEFKEKCENSELISYDGSKEEARDQNFALTSFAERLYKNILGRTYDEDGLNFWCDRVLSGTDTIDNVAAVGFFHSEEFSNMKLSDEEFVELLYPTFFNRAYDQEGYDYWLKYLADGHSRDEVLRGFLRSREFDTLKKS